MLGLAFSLLTSLFHPPAAWKSVHPVQPAGKAERSSWGRVILQYVLPEGGAVQVWKQSCRTEDDCEMIDDIGSNISDLSDCYCEGKCSAAKQKCIVQDKVDYEAWGPGWVRSSSSYGDNEVHILMVSRRIGEKAT